LTWIDQLIANERAERPESERPSRAETVPTFSKSQEETTQ
jgi:hypothetical protein